MTKKTDEDVIFNTARKIESPDAQSEYLGQVCEGDPALRERVENLLEAHRQESRFLEVPAYSPTSAPVPLDEPPGTQIGRYKVLQKIGEGGFGVVYMAEQTKPVRRKVALKIIKPGMDTNSVIARFEAERQALAMMDHPSIARVHDGGTTDNGRPFFVMELVKGVPITEYCDENQLDTRTRIQLFLAVCRAIQHAHQKGIIHRDLKPSNVLVTLHDGEPMIKVIDFGVAKAIHHRLTDRTLFTAFGQMVGTPQYMSPEQAEMSGLDVDTRSDVYSLGVILYELLTGTTPLQVERIRTAGYAEMQRLIREDDPEKPSVRLTTSGEELTIIAKHRSLSPEQLRQSVHGELDWIVMKALEKDRGRRYETPSSFADDIERYLSHEPVEACPPSTTYRMRKYVRRHRALFFTSAIVVFALIVATLVSCYSALKINSANRALQATLNRQKSLIVEIAMQDALSNNPERVEQRLKEDGKLIGESWTLTLQGAVALHQGKNAEAAALLNSAIAIDPGNTAAKSMLTIALFHDGRVEEWENHLSDLEDWKIRDEYRDLDKLFLAYAHSYTDFGKAIEGLEEVLNVHRNWTMAHVLLSIAYTEAGIDGGNRELVEKGLKQIEMPLLVAEDNPFVGIAALFAYNQAFRLEVIDKQQLSLAQPIADRLEQYPDYQVALQMLAEFYDLIDNRHNALEKWERLATIDRTFSRMRGIAELYRNGDDAKVFELDLTTDADVDSEIALGFVLAEAHRHPEASEAFDRAMSMQSSWGDKFKLVQLALVLRRNDLLEPCRTAWFSTETDSRFLESDFVRDVVSHVVRSTPMPQASSEVQHFILNYTKALLAFSEHRMEDCLPLLEKCVATRCWGTEYHWARAFLERWSDEENEDGRPNSQSDSAIRYSPNGSRIVAGAGHHDHAVTIWDAATGRQVVNFVAPKYSFTQTECSRDGASLMTIGGGGWVNLWESDAPARRRLSSYDKRFFAEPVGNSWRGAVETAGLALVATARPAS